MPHPKLGGRGELPTCKTPTLEHTRRGSICLISSHDGLNASIVFCDRIEFAAI